jgi:hypothetical protein
LDFGRGFTKDVLLHPFLRRAHGNANVFQVLLSDLGGANRNPQIAVNVSIFRHITQRQPILATSTLLFFLGLLSGGLRICFV